MCKCKRGGLYSDGRSFYALSDYQSFMPLGAYPWRMKPAEKPVMDDLRRGRTTCWWSRLPIEVGVDVAEMPACMVIENPERLASPNCIN